MNPEILTIIGVGIALAAVILPGQRAQRKEISELRDDMNKKFSSLSDDMGKLRERMAHLEGLLEGLREAITRDHNRAV